MTHDDIYDLVYYLIAPTHPETKPYYEGLLDLVTNLYDQISIEYTAYSKHSYENFLNTPKAQP